MSVTSDTNLLRFEKNRLKTFKNWNVENVFDSILAKIGFYYIGPTDWVKCYFCDVEIGMWDPKVNPVDQHLKWSSNCNLMRGQHTN